MNNLKKGTPYCKEALEVNPNSLHGLIHKGQQELDADEFEDAIHTLDQAKEHNGQNEKVQELLQKAHTLLKRSKQKDYYKVLGVDRDADERTQLEAMLEWYRAGVLAKVEGLAQHHAVARPVRSATPRCT